MSVRLLFDENTSPRLVMALDDLYPNSRHVSGSGLTSTSDLRIWEFARDNGFIVVTKDKDFREFSLAMGAPPKVIWIGMGNCSTDQIERAPRGNAIRISAFAESDRSALIIVNKS